jgi:hypothetical protein
MSSARKIEANRANARASTGPRTAKGKACAAQNARRHGLNLPVVSDPVLSEWSKALARKIAGVSGTETYQLACGVAEAEIDVIRIRHVRQDLFDRNISNVACLHKLAVIISDLTKQLVALDRYERRALSRRKFAIRAFDAARQQSGMR